MMAVAGQRPATPYPDRPGKAASPDLAARRAELAAAVAAGYWRTHPPAEEITRAGIRTLRFAPPGRSRGTLLHFHGGAFRIGCPEAIAPFAAALAKRCRITILCPAYRLAPEHPFPAAINDGWQVLRTLVQQGQRPLLLSGDSAGGAIAACIAGLALAATIPIRGLALLSPWLDLGADSASYDTNAASDPLFSKEAAREAASLYLQGLPARDARASPLFGSVAGFPPTYISVGSGEVLADDAERFHEAVLAFQPAARLDRIAGMEHVAVTRDLSLPGAAETFEALAAYIDAQLGSD